MKQYFLSTLRLTRKGIKQKKTKFNEDAAANFFTTFNTDLYSRIKQFHLNW